MRFGLIGERLGHSHSPRIHALLGNADYRLCAVAPQELDAFLKRRDFLGLNVTIPYKRAVMPYCDALTDAARRIGSVNTLWFTPDGRLWGDNTDYDGFCYLLRRAKINPKGKKAIVLGSGGTSATARCALTDLGAAEVVVVSRGGPVTAREAAKRHADAQLVVNATPVGMYPENGQSPLALEPFSALEGVVDVVYNPLRTALLLDAERRGTVRAGGLPMLVAQAAGSARRFLQKEFSDSDMEAVHAVLLRELTNLVLVGMPGSGKTEVGRRAALLLGRTFADTDQWVEQEAGMPIPALFAQRGEAAFRELESRAAAALGQQPGRVIATGGGAVLRRENVDALRQNGVVVRIKRDLGALDQTGRPLSSSQEALNRMKTEREPHYQACCDAAVENNTTIEQAAAAAVEAFYDHLGN